MHDNENKSNLTGILNESLEVEIKEEDIRKFMGVFEKVPHLVLKIAVSSNINAVKKFEGRIDEYKSQLTEEDLLKAKIILDMPTTKHQDLMAEIYRETRVKQFKTLSDSKAEAFLTKNMEELKKVLFD